MITLISYAPGMSGDFISYLIHQHPDYISVDESIIDDHNRYFFPYFVPFVVPEMDDNKTWNKPHWPDNIKDRVDKAYNKNVCVPTHWYLNTENADFADTFIRLYSDDEYTIRRAYAFWWLKSHSWCTDPWKRRIDEVNESMSPEQATELLSNYHNWKFLAFKMGIDMDDLSTYIRRRYEEIFRPGCKRHEIPGWTNIDVASVFDNTITNLSSVTLDSSKIKKYVNENNNLLESYGIVTDATIEIYYQTLENALRQIVNKKSHVDKDEIVRYTSNKKNWVK